MGIGIDKRQRPAEQSPENTRSTAELLGDAYLATRSADDLYPLTGQGVEFLSTFRAVLY